MTDKVRSVEVRTNEKGDVKDIFYLTTLFGSSSSIWKTDFDMTKKEDKELALKNCTPFAIAIRKVGSMFSNANIYLVDKDGNDIKDSNLISLLENPNPIQNKRSFFSHIEMCIRTYGYCPIYRLKPTLKSIPRALYIIHPKHFHLIGTGKSFGQTEKKGIIKEAYIECGDTKTKLDESEYFIIHNGEINIPCNEDEEIIFGTAVDSLSIPVSNWMAAMQASNSLITQGGPKGIIYNNDNSEAGNAAMSPKEQNTLLEKFKQKFGLMKKQFQVLISRAKLGWIPLNYDSGQLKLHEEDKRDTDKIANAVGINPCLLDDSKYDNQEAAKSAAYQDLLIPDGNNISESMNINVLPEGVYMKIDFSHIECLQRDQSKLAEVLQRVMDSVIKGTEKEIISIDEARSLLSEYMDIDPNKK